MATKRAADWTVDVKTGRSNSSKKFMELCGEVERLILSSGHALLNGQTSQTARLIMAQLAHLHGLKPVRNKREATHARD